MSDITAAMLTRLRSQRRAYREHIREMARDVDRSIAYEIGEYGADSWVRAVAVLGAALLVGLLLIPVGIVATAVRMVRIPIRVGRLWLEIVRAMRAARARPDDDGPRAG